MPLNPGRDIGVQQSVLVLVLDFTSVGETNGAVDNVESDLAFVEHEIAFPLCIELRGKADGWHDLVPWGIPGPALATCVAHRLDHVKACIVKPRGVDNRSHLGLFSMPPSEMKLPKFLLDDRGIPGPEVSKTDLDIEASPVWKPLGA